MKARAPCGRGCQAQARRAGGVGLRARSIVSSMNLLVHASATIAMISPTWDGATRASCSATTMEGSRAAASRTSSTLPASSIERRSTNGVSVWAARRSMSLSTPIGSPSGETTGTCRIPRFSISSITSPPKRSGVTVNAGALIASVTASSAGTPSATTLRRSRSVRIPTPSSSRRISAASFPVCDISRAASRSVASGSHTSGSPRIRLAAGCCCGSMFAGSDPGSGFGRANRLRATKRTPAGLSRRGTTASAGSR